MTALIISAMAGAGKSTAIANNPNLKMYDSDSQKFHYITNERGEYLDEDGEVVTSVSDRVEKASWPTNYIEDIISRSQENDVIFVSAHSNIRALLDIDGISYKYVVFHPDIKDEVVVRIRNRKTDQPNDVIANIVESRWDEWIVDHGDYTSDELVVLGSGEYLSDKLNDLLK